MKKKIKYIIITLTVLVCIILISFTFTIFESNNLIVSENNTTQKLSINILKDLKNKDFNHLERLHCSPYLIEQEQSDFNFYFKDFKLKANQIDFTNAIIETESNEEILISNRLSETKKQNLKFTIQTEPKNLWKLKLKEHKCFLVDTKF